MTLNPVVQRMPQVNYKNVMKEYNLGPNGGILTSLNLFATRFDQVCEPPLAQWMHGFERLSTAHQPAYWHSTHHHSLGDK